MDKDTKLSKGQVIVLVLASLPMAAVGGAGAVATFVNMDRILNSGASALGMVAAGEGATLICALVALAVTLMGQHTPPVVRLGMWLLPLIAAGAGVAMASSLNERIMMAVTPMAMTAAGEGVAFVARRVVAHRTGVDIEQQRRTGLIVWHANRAANGGKLAKMVSRVAVWRLMKHFAMTDSAMSASLNEIQRVNLANGANLNLAAVLGGGEKRALTAAERPAVPELVSWTDDEDEAVSEAPAPFVTADLTEFVQMSEAEGDDWIREVTAEGEANVYNDPLVKLMTTAEVAAAKGVKEGTVRSWKARGQLRVHDTVDGRPMFHPADVAKLD